ncbi:kielin/chordin-like protein [Dreissena polymorpha]|uniref:kielin/chordin-like protein n=1 Tax=Dreissena polymorpha TaxID=45954 RepID=UPI00226465D7|nr:kielin/chordin-like protein [Dreissena polymorpha]
MADKQTRYYFPSPQTLNIVNSETRHLYHNCSVSAQIFCGHIPCPLPPCNRPLVTSPGDCCWAQRVCVNVKHWKYVASDPCPINCTQGGVHFCHPIPCPIPSCVDGETKPGECCASCPNSNRC